MATALVGHTGLVGSTLLRQTQFDACFHRANAQEMRGQSFDLLVCSAAPAVKWQANREPADDWANLQRLLGDLAGVRAKAAVLISTVDVYPSPFDVDEDTPIDPELNHPYGRHRYRLEEEMRTIFPTLSIVRLPALFGEGLKKNLVFDLLMGRDVSFVRPDSTFQFYDLKLLWRDITTTLSIGTPLMNIVTEPVRALDVASDVFGVEIPPARPDVERQDYRVRSRHSASWGRDDGYLYGTATVLDRMRQFVAQTRGMA